MPAFPPISQRHIPDSKTLFYKTTNKCSSKTISVRKVSMLSLLLFLKTPAAENILVFDIMSKMLKGQVNAHFDDIQINYTKKRCQS